MANILVAVTEDLAGQVFDEVLRRGLRLAGLFCVDGRITRGRKARIARLSCCGWEGGLWEAARRWGRRGGPGLPPGGTAGEIEEPAAPGSRGQAGYIISRIAPDLERCAARAPRGSPFNRYICNKCAGYGRASSQRGSRKSLGPRVTRGSRGCARASLRPPA